MPLKSCVFYTGDSPQFKLVTIQVLMATVFNSMKTPDTSGFGFSKPNIQVRKDRAKKQNNIKQFKSRYLSK